MRQQFANAANIGRGLIAVFVFRNVFCDLNSIFANSLECFRSVIRHLFPPVDSATIRVCRTNKMQITEPVTMLTDYALGAVNLFFAISILTKLHSRNKVSGLLLLLGFLSQAVSGFAGGTYHGFAAQFEAHTIKSVWN